MGLLPGAMELLRSILREKINQEPEGLDWGGDKLPWLEGLDGLIRARAPDFVSEHFWTWVRDTFTWVPADRPNWSLFAGFFFPWSIGMRAGKDNAGCFTDAGWVYRTYCSFLPLRGLNQRIRDAKANPLSAWDERMFLLRRYSFREEDLEDGEYRNPLGIVESTAEMNYFQQFWEFLYPRLTDDERGRLYDATLSYYHQMSFFTELVTPDKLTRNVR